MNASPKIDIVFKKLFATEENKDLLMSLINSVLPKNEQVVKIELKNPYQVSDYIGGKNSVLDIKAQDENGIFFDIEMQITHYDFYPKRTLFYWAKMFSSQIDTSPNRTKHTVYKELTKCIVISFMDFSFFEDENYLRCFTIVDRETNERHAALDYLELYFIELPKFKENLSIMETVKTIQSQWLTFLKKGYDENGVAQYLNFDDPLVEKAREQLRIMDFNFDEQEYYEGQLKVVSDHNAVVEYIERLKTELSEKAQENQVKAQENQAKAQENQAKAQEIDEKALKVDEKAQENQAKAALLAKQELALEKQQQEIDNKRKELEIKSLENAKRLLKTDLNDEFIALATGLSEDEVEKLRKEM